MTSENSTDNKHPETHANAESNEQSGSPQPQVLSATAQPQTAPSPHHCEITCNKKRDAIDKATLVLEGFGLFVLIVYTVFTGLMWCANKRAADAAKSAADTARDALKMVNRPWLGIDGSITVLKPVVIDKEGLHTELGFQIKNFGPGPAMHIGRHEIIRNASEDALPNGTVDFSNFKREADISCKIADANAKPIVPGEMGSGPYIFPNNFISYDSHVTTVPPPNIANSLDVVGCITYSDQFKSTHHTRFCFMGQRSIKNTVAMDQLIPCPINQDAN
jgi:hypothetical protein